MTTESRLARAFTVLGIAWVASSAYGLFMLASTSGAGGGKVGLVPVCLRAAASAAAFLFARSARRGTVPASAWPIAIGYAVVALLTLLHGIATTDRSLAFPEMYLARNGGGPGASVGLALLVGALFVIANGGAAWMVRRARMY